MIAPLGSEQIEVHNERYGITCAMYEQALFTRKWSFPSMQLLNNV